ncbi:MAG: TolC family protein, partial [Phycisphaerales bacterium]|nr:TolC family protein [Phycisphaerales bacterium]
MKHISTLSIAVLLVGCSSNLPSTSDEDLRRSVVEVVERELDEARRHPTRLLTERETVDLGIAPQFMPELLEMGGPSAIANEPLEPGDDLFGGPAETSEISLEHAIRTTIERNLELEFARLTPAISESQVVAAQAAFDWVFFSNLEWNIVDQPRQSTTFSGFSTGGNTTEAQNVASTTGLRRQLSSGGAFTIQNAITYRDDSSNGTDLQPDPSWTLGITAQFDQPLLRDFGSDVALAQVRLAQNAERSDVHGLKAQLITTVTNVERAYWNLYIAHRSLLINQRLLKMGIETRQKLIGRRPIDANDAQIADATARIESRRANVLRSQRALRQASRQLKLLMNDPSLPIGEGIILVPSNEALDLAIEFSLLDSIGKAVQSRPEVHQAILSIDDTMIRYIVANNQRLPQLDLRMQAQFNELNDSLSEPYKDIVETNFVDTLIGLFFEQPVGNRAAEALMVQRRLERMQAVTSYANTIRQIVAEVTNALDDVVTNYTLIEQSRATRLAAAEVLRVLRVENEQR